MVSIWSALCHCLRCRDQLRCGLVLDGDVGTRISLALWARRSWRAGGGKARRQSRPAAKKKSVFMARSSRDDDAGRPDSNQVEDDVDVAARRLRVRDRSVGSWFFPFAFMRLLARRPSIRFRQRRQRRSAKACGGFLGRLCPMPPVMVTVRIFFLRISGIGAGVRMWCALASPSIVIVGTVS